MAGHRPPTRNPAVPVWTSPLDGIEREEVEHVKQPQFSPRERSFILAFMRHGNAARALKDAGTTTGRPAEKASRVMARPHVRAEIEFLQNQRLERMKVTSVRIEEELAKVAFANIGDIITIQEDGTPFYDLSNADEYTLASINSMKIETVTDGPSDAPRQVLRMEIKREDKLGALRTLAQIKKMIGNDMNLTLDVDLASMIRSGRQRAGLIEQREDEGE